jgi:signal transduction histidine kinase
VLFTGAGFHCQHWQGHRAQERRDDQDEFIGMVSHELKTPLTVVTGTEHGDPGVSSGNTGQLLQDAAWGAETMADIVDVELGGSRAARMQPSPLDVGQTMDRLVEQSSKKSNSTVTAEVAPGLPSVSADRIRIDRILDLIDNAIKYSQGGDVKVSARHNSGDVLASVSDQGGHRCRSEKLFQPFQRFETVPEPSRGGAHPSSADASPKPTAAASAESSLARVPRSSRSR